MDTTKRKTKRQPSRRVPPTGSERVKSFIETHNLRPVQLSIPRDLHDALDAMIDRIERGNAETVPTKQYLVERACHPYGNPWAAAEAPLRHVPAAMVGVDSRFTWYAPWTLYLAMRSVSAQRNSSMRQLIISALLECYKSTPEIAPLLDEYEIADKGSMRAPS